MNKTVRIQASNPQGKTNDFLLGPGQHALLSAGPGPQSNKIVYTRFVVSTKDGRPIGSIDFERANLPTSVYTEHPSVVVFEDQVCPGPLQIWKEWKEFECRNRGTNFAAYVASRKADIIRIYKADNP